MEGRYPSGIMLFTTYCNDPSREDEFNHWYNYVHLPDLTAPGIFQNAMRFLNLEPQPGETDHPEPLPPKPGGGKYVATYECSREDVSKAFEDQRDYAHPLREQGRGSSLIELSLWGVFKKLGGETCAAKRPVRSILGVLMRATDPAREKEFRSWYADIHVPDVLDTGLYHAAYRYEALDPQTCGGGTHLALYETDRDDPVATFRELRKLRENWEKRGRLFEDATVVLRINARRTWPML